MLGSIAQIVDDPRDSDNVLSAILNIISILVVYILKLSIIYALCLTLTYQVISYFMLFIGLNEIFYEKKA